MAFSGTVKIGFTVKGLQEGKRIWLAMMNELPQTKTNIHRTIATEGVKSTKPFIHNITHTLERSMRVDVANENVGMWSANTFYARLENRREGKRRIAPFTRHNYMTQGAAAVSLKVPNIIKNEFSLLINRHKGISL